MIVFKHVALQAESVGVVGSVGVLAGECLPLLAVVVIAGVAHF
jgi:hypothetical protein